MGQVFSFICDKCCRNQSKPSSISEAFITAHGENQSIVDIEQDDCQEPQLNTLLDHTIIQHSRTHTGHDSSEPVLNITERQPSLSECVTARPSLKHYRERSPSNTRKSVKKSKVEDYLDFHIINDELTIEFIKKSKVAVIMRGLSGSGKSHIVKKLIECYGENAIECSADLYFVQEDGRYEFDFNFLKDAHNYCFESAKLAMSQSQHPLVIINNTNIQFWEYKRYLSLAKDHHYTVLILYPQTPWAWDPAMLAQRTQHGMDEETLTKKLSQFQLSQPMYFGWFLNLSNSAQLLQCGHNWLSKLIALPACRHQLTQCCFATAPQVWIDGKAPDRYYEWYGKGGPFHCTAFFANRGRVAGADEYMQRQAVGANMGRAHHMLVTGFVVTPRTLGARVVLTDQQLSLWGQPDDASSMPDRIAELFEATRDCQDAVQEESLQEQQLFQSGLAVPELTADLMSRTTLQNVSWKTAQEITGDSSLGTRSPSRLGSGSRAHFTLATAPGVSASVTGYDLLHLLEKEQHAKYRHNTQQQRGEDAMQDQSNDDELMDVSGVENEEQCGAPGSEGSGVVLHSCEGGTIADYGEGVFAVYLEKPIQLDAFFTASYL